MICYLSFKFLLETKIELKLGLSRGVIFAELEGGPADKRSGGAGENAGDRFTVDVLIAGIRADYY